MSINPGPPYLYTEMDRDRDQNSGNNVLVLDGSHPLRRSLRTLAPVFRATAFWVAVALPWIALGLLFTGVATDRPVFFVLLVLVAFLSAFVGRDHTRR